MFSNFSLIFHEGPISRSYLNIFKQNNIKINEIIYLISNNYKFFPKKIATNLNFRKNNYFPLEYLRTKQFDYLLDQIIERFSLPNNFIQNVYKSTNLEEHARKVYYIKSENINNSKLKFYINKSDSSFFLFTSGGILKKETLSAINKKIIHIHPGYLPKVRGADAVLWSILKFNELGSTSFIMNEKIDDGKIIYRESIDFKKFKFKKDISNLEFYRFIFSFLDPIIRIRNIDKKISNEYFKRPRLIKKEDSNYFSFMNNEQILKTKFKFFIN